MEEVKRVIDELSGSGSFGLNDHWLNAMWAETLVNNVTGEVYSQPLDEAGDSDMMKSSGGNLDVNLFFGQKAEQEIKGKDVKKGPIFDPRTDISEILKRNEKVKKEYASDRLKYVERWTAKLTC